MLAPHLLLNILLNIFKNGALNIFKKVLKQVLDLAAAVAHKESLKINPDQAWLTRAKSKKRRFPNSVP